MSLQKLIDKLKNDVKHAIKESETCFYHLKIDLQEYSALLEAAEVMREALEKLKGIGIQDMTSVDFKMDFPAYECLSRADKICEG